VCAYEQQRKWDMTDVRVNRCIIPESVQSVMQRDARASHFMLLYYLNHDITKNVSLIRLRELSKKCFIVMIIVSNY